MTPQGKGTVVVEVPELAARQSPSCISASPKVCSKSTRTRFLAVFKSEVLFSQRFVGHLKPPEGSFFEGRKNRSSLKFGNPSRRIFTTSWCFQLLKNICEPSYLDHFFPNFQGEVKNCSFQPPPRFSRNKSGPHFFEPRKTPRTIRGRP